MGVDVGRFGDMTEAVIIKVTPAPTGVARKQIVNIYTFEAEHFEKQAIHLKRLFKISNAICVFLTATGLTYTSPLLVTINIYPSNCGKLLK